MVVPMVGEAEGDQEGIVTGGIEGMFASVLPDCFLMSGC